MAIEVQEVIQVPDKKSYVLFGDSVAGNTIIEYKDINDKINKLSFEVYFKTRVFNIIEFSDGSLRGLTSDKVKNIVNGKIVWSEVQYVYAHKVSKPCWQITSKKTKKFVQLTNDHSAIVFRDNKLQKVKPVDINITQDKILVNIDDDCIIDEISKCEYIRDFNNEFVYDLSIASPKEQHTFIANGILVHNTDSCSGYSIIKTIKNKKKLISTIADLFAMSGVIIKAEDREFVFPKGVKTLVYNPKAKKDHYKSIKFIYRHKVSKEQYQIVSASNPCHFVNVTKDHSIMVLRDKELIEVKPTKIKSDDKLIVNGNIVGIKELKRLQNFDDEYVYDVGIGGSTPYFYANNILVHNSFGANVEPLVESLLKGKVPTKDWKREDVDKICQILDDKIIPLVNNNCAKIVKEKFLSDVSTIEFKREKFCGAACFLAKKHYAVYVLNNEGVSESTWIHKGTAIKQSALPKPIKEFLKLVVETGLLENWDNSKFMAICNDYYNEFKTYDILDISKSAGYSTEKVFRKPFDKTGVTAFGAIAANYYNDMINYLNLGHKYDKIRVGDKFRVAYVKPNNKWKLEYIGFPGVWPEEFNKYFEFDYKTMFAKYILKPLEGFMKVFKWKNPDFTKQAVINIDDL